MERTRLFYRAQGFGKEYVWAHYGATPFSAPCQTPRRLRCHSSDNRGRPSRDTQADQKSRKYSFLLRPPARFDTSELSWDKETTHTDDRQSYFPLEVLGRLAGEGVIKRRFKRIPLRTHPVQPKSDQR